ncbi:DUF1731 domain-containing protein [Leucobacter allii]|uniref:epimerase n=1 Tax=Leucobacter allii TaxID=2932247 RepID=UPI001FD0E1E1|nr:DUF1731 domain-containing protein [Leucobacter allii]UOR03401.1 DUF1731 domain-containing protein [Leucobacter allii]
MGRHLQHRYAVQGREVVTIGRSGADLVWDDTAGIAAAVDGAALVVGLAGKSVDCRYTPANRAEILRSRTETTAALHRAIGAADHPPELWVNSSTATIYRHAEDRPMTEASGELGAGFSVDVARAWEAALFHGELRGTRRVALRSAIVLGPELAPGVGGVLGPLRTLARLGLGGAQHDGRWPVGRRRREAGTAHLPGARGGKQRFSWIHVEDAARVLDFLEATPELTGPVNAAAPHPVDNATFMRVVRRAVGAAVGPPLPRWMLELGALGIRTETELILKSRWVLPARLTEAGFAFRFPEIDAAVADALAR